MNERTKNLWVIPIVISMATGIMLGAIFMFLGPWLTGTPIHPSFSLGWLELALFAYLPMWVTLSVLLVTAILAGLFLRQRARTAEETKRKKHLEAQIAKLDQERKAEIESLNAKKPRLHGIWNSSQTFWSSGRKGQEPMMQIGGWIDLTSSNTDQIIYLLAAYIGGLRSDMFMNVTVKPSIVNREQVILYMVPPLEADVTKSFTAAIVVEDQYNRKYDLPVHTFPAIPGHPPPAPANIEEPRPALHASWRGDSTWGWATPHPEENPIYVVRGDVTLLMDAIAEPVIITGVEIEGAESMGKFDNFQLHPKQPVTRGIQVYFRGKAPKGTDDYTVQLVFKDLRGNRYPTVEHRFKPLPIPERVDIQRQR